MLSFFINKSVFYNKFKKKLVFFITLMLSDDITDKIFIFYTIYIVKNLNDLDLTVYKRF